MPDSGSTDPSRDHSDDRYDVLLHPDDEMVGPEWYPRLANMSAAFMFRALIRPDTCCRAPKLATTSLSVHTEVVWPYGHADGAVGSVTDSKAAAAEVSRTGRLAPAGFIVVLG